MIRTLRGAVLGAALLGISGLLAGCSADENTPEARIAEDALGVEPVDGIQRTTEVQRDVLVNKRTQVVDQKTGEILSESSESTPVTVKKEREVQTGVDVNVGETRVTDPQN